LVHRGQRVGVTPALGGDGFFAERVVGGAAVRDAVADPPACKAEEASLPVAAAAPLAPTWTPEAVIGFPQSMQNREVASFSRPQKEQAVNRHPPRLEKLMAREYRNNQPPREDHLYLHEGGPKRFAPFWSAVFGPLFRVRRATLLAKPTDP
jgi:hypothetical protein